MKSLFQLILCLHLSALLIAAAPPETITLNKDVPFKQDWARFFSNSPQPEPNTAPVQRSDTAHKDQIDNYFFNPLPGYEAFNKWFFKAMDNGAKSIYEAIKQSYMDPTFEPPTVLTSTPFPIPPQFQRVYSWLLKQNPSLNSATATDANTHKPIFDGFYSWFYDKQKQDQDWKQHFEDSKKLPHPRFRDLAATPFPIPKKFHVYYYHEMMHPNRTITRSNYTFSSDDKNKVNEFFGGTVSPEFEDFYQWFYNKQQQDENWLPALNLAQQLDFRNSEAGQTPFPVPPEYLSYYFLSETDPNDTSSSIQYTGTPTDLDALLNEANSLGDYAQFSNWLGEASPFRRNLLKKVCEITQQRPEKTSQASTPFPVPEPLRDAFCWAISNENVNNTDTNPTTFYRNKLEEFFKKPHLPIHDLFYQWLYDVETDAERALARSSTNQPIELDFARWMRFTPFPVPAEHLHKFAYINAVESMLNISTKRPETNTKSIQGNGATQPYQQFTQWLEDTFGNDQELIQQKFRECQRDNKFELRNMNTATPFSVPFSHFRFYHWVNAHQDDLKKTTVTKADPKLSGSNTKNSPFVQWLNQLFNNDQALIAEKVRECQNDVDFEPIGIGVTAPFDVPLSYFRFYHWINAKQHPEYYQFATQPSPTSTTKPTAGGYFRSSPSQPIELRAFARKSTTDADDDDGLPPPTTPSYIEFTNWLNKILDHKRDLITQKFKECQHDQDFNPREIKEPTPFPVPLRFYRFYNWLNAKVKAGEHKKAGVIHTAPVSRYATTGKPGVSFMTTRKYPEYTQFLFNLFKNDQPEIEKKLRECQIDPTFNPRAIKVNTPFPVPIRHFRLFHWLNSKLHPNEYTYSEKDISRPTPMALEPTYSLVNNDSDSEMVVTEESTTDGPVPPTKSYLEFTQWLNKILDDDANLIEQKIKECQHDQEYNPRDIKETTPFPIPIHHYRFYHWLNSKYKAGEHKKQGITHTAPASRYPTTGKPGVSFMTTRDYPEYKQWIFSLFKNDQKQINEKLEECRQDQNFHLNENNASTPFPIPMRFYRFYHWLSSKLTTQQPST